MTDEQQRVRELWFRAIERSSFATLRKDLIAGLRQMTLEDEPVLREIFVFVVSGCDWLTKPEPSPMERAFVEVGLQRALAAGVIEVVAVDPDGQPRYAPVPDERMTPEARAFCEAEDAAERSRPPLRLV